MNRFGDPTEAGMPISRRGFLGTAAALAGVSLLGAEAPGEEPARLRIPYGTPRSQVTRVRSARVVSDGIVDEKIVDEMLSAALVAQTGASDAAGSWRKILDPSDIVGIKFNRSGQTRLGTTVAVADALIGSLRSAGWQASQIVCIEAPAGIASRHATALPRAGYSSSPVDFGSGQDELASVLDQITAIIDVPYLKSHNIAGMTCSLKNLSHGLVKHPARYHRNGCSPYVGDIVGLPAISGKLRLCIVDALRVVFDGGPEPGANNISDQGMFLLSSDPVAVDAVGLSILNGIRKDRGLHSIAPSADSLAYLAAAHRAGLGVALLQGIDIMRIEV